MQPNALANISLAKRALDEARDITDVLQVRDVAVAAHAYATARGADEVAQAAVEVKLRAERKAGEFLQEMPKHNGGRPPKTYDKVSEVLSLPEMGITHKESSRWQRIAGIPEDRFEEYLSKAKQKTQSALLAAARHINHIVEDEEQAKERRALPVKASIKCCHYANLVQELGPNSIDLLITDPPYMTDLDDIEDFVAFWIDPVLDTLKDSGQAYIFTGAYYDELKAYINNLDKSSICTRFTKQLLVWEYRNTLGPSPKNQYKQNWQAIFYLRGPEAPPINTDRLTELFTVQEFNMPGMLGHGVNYHTWEKPIDLAKQLIRHGSTQGSFIFDPFAGTGTFLLAAAELGRRNIGCDIDPDMVEIAQRRGCILN